MATLLYLTAGLLFITVYYLILFYITLLLLIAVHLLIMPGVPSHPGDPILYTFLSFAAHLIQLIY